MPKNNNSKIEDLYYRFTNEFLGELNSNEFYLYFLNSLKSGSAGVNLTEKYIDRKVDIQWIEKIEDTIVHLDSVIRNPLRFIKNEEEIVPIEMARTISSSFLIKRKGLRITESK